jgi:SagB-type dehydrogenase family enzyme
MALPRNILDAAERVLDFHRSTRLDESSARTAPDASKRPPTAHVFDYAAKVPLSNRLLDAPTPMLTLLEHGLESVPESLHAPPQDLRTLSSWLYLAAGQRKRIQMPWGDAMLRAVPSAEMSYPGEIYVAAFSIAGLAPGLYHYSVKEHALRHLRDAPETLYLLRRGRPDLQFLGTIPAVLLVSSVFCRSSWQHGRRGYRQAVIDCGHLVESLHVAAMGLGMSTVTRLRMTESSMRELIGLPEDADYAHAESVQAMLAWADGATVTPQIESPKPPVEVYGLPRPACEGVVGYGSVMRLHDDVTATGVAIREVRPPLTDLTPVPTTIPMTRLPLANELAAGRSCRIVMLDSQHVPAFHPRPISRELIVRLARSAFRGGTFFPLKPDGPHTALVRPFWVMQDVIGQDPGIWWYDPVIDKWAQLNHGQYKHETGPLTGDRESLLVGAAAVCVLVVNMKRLLTEAGPDLYRLAHLEAGIAAERLALAAASVGVGCRMIGDFYDEPWKNFLGLGTTGWEPLLLCALGGIPGQNPSAETETTGTLEFRD